MLYLMTQEVLGASESIFLLLRGLVGVNRRALVPNLIISVDIFRCFYTGKIMNSNEVLTSSLNAKRLAIIHKVTPGHSFGQGCFDYAMFTQEIEWTV